MTWSIIARDASGRFGIAVASRFFAVGARVPFIAAGIGAVATQAMVNGFFGTDGLKLLRAGVPADETLRRLVAADAGRDHRQVHVIDAAGRIAAHTGEACVDWCGHLAGAASEGFSIAGNMLAGPRVLDDTAAAYRANAGLPLPRRLIAAMRAGEAAGGDKRGRLAAALVIHHQDDWAELDLRVDDHADPLAELARLEAVSRERAVHFARYLPNRRDPVGTTDRLVIEAGIAAALATEAAAEINR